MTFNEWTKALEKNLKCQSVDSVCTEIIQNAFRNAVMEKLLTSYRSLLILSLTKESVSAMPTIHETPLSAD